jgi:organic radical activating enzyme
MIIKQIISADVHATRSIFQKDGENYLNISEFFYDTIQGEGIYAGFPACFLRLQQCTLDCVYCFHENTLIQTLEGGLKKIKDIQKGEVLLTLDKHKNIVQTTVKETMKRIVDIKEQMLKIVIDYKTDHPLVLTKNHKIYVKEKGWIKAGELQKGDILISLLGSQVVSYKMTKFNPMKHKRTRKKMSNTYKARIKSGEITPYTRSEELRLGLSLGMKGDKNPMKDPEVAKRSMLGHWKSKSSLEKRYEKIFQRKELPITYIGDNKLAIGNRKTGYRFPDFIIDGKKKIIEIYNTTFPWYAKTGYRKRGDYEWNRLQHYKQFGYDVLFLTEKDLKEEDRLQEKLFDFVFNGSIITDITTNIPSKSYARLFGSSDVTKTEVYNLSCTPYPTYLANRILVHNCDTTEVWRVGSPFNFEQILTLMNTGSLIKKLEDKEMHLVLTGGSPLLQQQRLYNFVRYFIDRFNFSPFIEIENECVIMPKTYFAHNVDCWNNSPKLSSSGVPKKDRYKPDVLMTLSSFCNSWFKFVVDCEEDWEEIQMDFLEPGLIKKEQVILMPEGCTRMDLLKKREMVVNMAIQHGVRYSDRLHIILWDKTVGC